MPGGHEEFAPLLGQEFLALELSGPGIVSDRRNRSKSAVAQISQNFLSLHGFSKQQRSQTPKHSGRVVVWEVHGRRRENSEMFCLTWRQCLAAMLSASALMVLASPARAQRERGELQIEVKDPQGRSTAATGEIVSESNQVKKEFAIGADGKYLAQELAFGVYRLTVSAEGFAAWTGLLEVRSEVPVRIAVVLGMAPVNTKVEVTDAATLLDPSETGTIYSLSGETLREHEAAQQGRDLSDAVNDQPGWLYEANGALHPRGSEYQVQYVLDGMPLTQNRSTAFAAPLDAGDVESMRVMTAGYAAEYGRSAAPARSDIPAAKITSKRAVRDFIAGGISILRFWIISRMREMATAFPLRMNGIFQNVTACGSRFLEATRTTPCRMSAFSKRQASDRTRTIPK